MSGPERTDGGTAARRPVASRICDARPRARVSATGTICLTEVVAVGGSFAYRCVLTDGTGELDALFLGRTAVVGLTAGTQVSVTGTAGMYGGRLVVWNPRYRLAECDGARADPQSPDLLTAAPLAPDPQSPAGPPARARPGASGRQPSLAERS